MWGLWELPTTFEIDDIEYAINTDYRDILQIISILQNMEISNQVKVSSVLQIFYVDEVADAQKAIDILMMFINCGEIEDDKIPVPKQIDWEQDYLSIAADVNKSANMEIRAVEYLHWFTFISYFNSIGEGQLSQIVGIRNKIRKGEKLEKYEREYYQVNKNKIVFKEKYTTEEQEEIDELLKLLGE